MDYSPLYEKYNKVLRPLISEYEGREENFEEPLLKSMAYMVDNLSFCVGAENQEKQQNHFAEAQKNLEEAVVNAYKYLVYSHHRELKKFKRRFTKKQLEICNGGNLVGEFYADDRAARRAVIKGRRSNNVLDSMADYKKAYELYAGIEKMIAKFNASGVMLQHQYRGFLIETAKFVLSLIVSVTVAYFWGRIK